MLSTIREGAPTQVRHLGMKGGCHVYQPYWHRIITRGDVHLIKISEVELMEWYCKRAYVIQSGLGWG
jgi:hypothetical protein